jgi:hypothetical protein
MRRIVCRLAVAAIALCGWAGAASAADPVVMPVSVISPLPVIASTLPEASAVGGVIPVSGCASCSANGGAGYSDGKPYYGWLIRNGCKNEVNCGSFASERTFFFGSCRQFFNPGYDCAGPHCPSIQRILYGTGGIGSHNNCEYGSFNNR